MKNIKGVDLYNFIKPHLGSILATGSHSTDCQKLCYFEIREELLNCLIEDLEESYLNSLNSQEHSVQMINEKCIEQMKDLYNWLRDYIKEYNTKMEESK